MSLVTKNARLKFAQCQYLADVLYFCRNRLLICQPLILKFPLDRGNIWPTACCVYSCQVFSGLKVMSCFSLVLSVLFPVLVWCLILLSFQIPSCPCVFPPLRWSAPSQCVSAVCYYPYLPCLFLCQFIFALRSMCPSIVPSVSDPILWPYLASVSNFYVYWTCPQCRLHFWKPWTACESCIRVYTWCVWILSTTSPIQTSRGGSR